VSPRVLIITADIGAGHDLPAKLLADGLRERGAEVAIEDGLDAMGAVPRAVARNGAETILRRLPYLFELQYRLATRFGPTRRLTQWLSVLLGGRGLLATVRRHRADVVVSTYPGTTEVLGRLRAAGRLEVPVVSAITDLAALRYWASSGVDLHLMIHAESAEEVESIVGRSTRIRHVRGFVRPDFEAPPSREEARAALDLPAAGPIVLVSGGGWGVGDVEAAARAVLAIPDAIAVCLCGTNDGLARRLEERHRDDPRLRVLPFTERMCEWMAAADVLVHSTAGLTVLEAQLCGTHAVSFGWGVAHVRANNDGYRRFGLAEVADDARELARLLPALLARPRARDLDYGALPAAADAVLELTPVALPGR
jgi:processive 1,2-diacylglycerol beta-glucosyltransferase